MTKWLVLLLLSGTIWAQTDAQRKQIQSKTDLAELQSLSRKFTRIAENQKTVALNLALQKNLSVSFTKDSVFSELIRFNRFGTPIYYSTYNYGAGITARADRLYTGGSLGLDINGENMVAGIWDGGSGFPEHEIFEGRLTVMDGTTQTHFHATHVCGTVIGTNQVQNGLARGLAYKANGWSYDWSNDLGEVSQAAASGLLLSNHSYGYSPQFVAPYQWGKYDDEAAAVDQIMNLAPYYQFVCAAGNSRGTYNLDDEGFDLLLGHTNSKNSIAVAAVQEVLDYTGPESVVISGFSSWGPTDDGRIKPDLSTKGVSVLSSTNSSITAYATYSGTSMASPGVTGTLLLLQQYFNQLNNGFMRAATLRGLAIHTADEAGNAPGPDYGYGWGLINAEAAAKLILKRDLQSYIQENTLAQGQTYELNVEALGDEPLLATICWNDPAGASGNDVEDDPTPSLVNDLDIRILQNGTIVYPWRLDPSQPGAAATQGDNTVDNVERAQIALPAGNYTIRVSHKGNLQNGSQSYSLIVSGVNIKEFWFATTAETPAVCTGTSSAAYPFSLETRTNFSGNVALSVAGLPANATAQFSPANLSASGIFTLTLNGLENVTPGTYPLTVHGQSGSDFYDFPITLTIYQPITQSPDLSTPADAATGVLQPVSLEWAADMNAQFFELQVATDAAFGNIISQQAVSTNTFTLSGLTDSATYFWRVRSGNSCGLSAYSAPRSFTTACAAPATIQILNATTTSATLSWNDSAGSGNFQYLLVPQGSGLTGTWLTAGSNPLVLSGLSVESCYDFYVRSVCDGGPSNASGPFTFCTQLDYCGGAHFVDTGGLNGSYPDNQFLQTTVFPQQLDQRVRAHFDMFATEEDYDFLSVYNGPDTTGALLFYGSGTLSPADVVSTHITGALTFVFASDGFVTGPGWDISFTCEALPPCAGMPNDITVSGITATSAQLQWNENNGSTQWQYSLVPLGNAAGDSWTTVSQNPVLLTDLAPGTCYSFFLRSVCGSDVSPVAGPTDFCTTPDFCAGVLFTDSGGTNGGYGDMETQLTVIYPAQEGHAVQATFTAFALEDGFDYLRIFNGPGTANPLLFIGTGTNSPGTVISTHPSGALSFYFTSDQFVTDAGWEAQIDCETLGTDGQSPKTISYYPNPVSDVLNIRSGFGMNSYVVYDANLRTINDGNASGQELRIDLSGFAAGLYLVRITDVEGREYSLKVLHR